MTCAEFQRVLPYIIDTGGNAEQEEHLRECAVCADLVADLKYIAEQAKLLVPMEDPSPRVWDGLQKSLEREGLVRSAPARRELLEFPARRSWGWIAAVAAALVVVAGLLYFRAPRNAESAETKVVKPEITAQSAMVNDDQQVLDALSDRSPNLRPAYEQGLRAVNAYIQDAQHTVDQNPESAEARQFLMQAYEQKAMLYQMAARSSQ